MRGGVVLLTMRDTLDAARSLMVTIFSVCSSFLLLRVVFWSFFFFLMIRRPPRSTLDRSSAASDVYKRQVLGWAAVTGDVTADALLLFLIIFAWTPPHFWALALYRKNEYASIGMPMLPVTHGDQFTKLHVLLYTIILCIVTTLPYVTQMSGLIYLASSIVLNGIFMYLSLIHI